jgi:WD40 repeat protein/serine/threonine protein kinase
MSASDECLDDRAALAFVENRMTPERQAAVEQHIEDCDSCRVLLGRVAQLRRAEKPSAFDSVEMPVTEERYTVVGEHARGGQARVLIAFDENVGREVALKELLPRAEGGSSDDSWRDATARFLREAELTGKLVHPGIVPVFEIGQRPDGSLYYTMQLVRGRTLSEALLGCRSLAERLGLLSHFLSICNVVAYAHSRGVIHRDLKPGNIMVGDFGEAVLLDWGLAKERGELDAAPITSPQAGAGLPENVTREGTVVGTPGYMSPEQANGQIGEIDERSDIYGLGAVLFEILTGKPPLPAATESGTAPRVRAYCSEAPSELAGVAEKALAPLKTGRYQQASVRAYCSEAPPELAGVAEKALAPLKADRYQQASELAQDVTAFMTGGRVSAYVYSTSDLVKRFAARHKLLLGAAGITLATILTALVLLSLAWRSEGASRSSAIALGQVALREGANRALMQGDLLEARAKLRGALELGDTLEARALWRRLRTKAERFVARFSLSAYSVSFAPDGRTLAVGMQNGNIQLLDTTTRAARVLRGAADSAFCLAHSPDGRFLAAGAVSGKIALWDFEREEFSFLQGSAEEALVPRMVSFDDSGTLLATLGSGGKVVIWDLSTQTVRERLQMPTRNAVSASLSADGRRLAATGQDCNVMVWDLETHAPLMTLSGPAEGVAFGHDGTFVAGGGSDGNIYLWSASSGALLRVLRGHENRIRRVAVSRDDRFLASASADGTVRLWSLPSGELLRVFPVVKSLVRDVSFSADGALLSAAAESSAWVWDISVPVEPTAPSAPSRLQNTARFAPDGAQIAGIGMDGQVRIWETASGELRASWSSHEASGTDICFSPDGKFVASVGYDGLLLIHDAASGNVRHRMVHGKPWTSVDCAPDSRHVASGGFDTSFRIWDAITGELVRAIPGPPSLAPTVVRYSPDGRMLAVGRQGGAIELWDASSGQRIRELVGHAHSPLGLAFNSSGTLLASAAYDQTLRLWSTADGTGRVLGETAGRSYSLAWDEPRGRLLVPTSTGEIELWSLSGGLRAKVKAHAGEVNSIVLSPNGAMAVSAGEDGTVRLWDASTWRPTWYTRAMVWTPEPQILTHTGWHAVDPVSGQRVSLDPAMSAWRRAVEAAKQAEALPQGPICVTTEHGLEIWEGEKDHPALKEPIEQPFEVAALPRGCSVLREGRVKLYRLGAPPVDLASALFQSGGQALVAIGSIIELFDSEGRTLGIFGSGADVTAAAPLRGALAVGFRDGGIELRSISGAREPVDFQDTPGSAVRRLVAGPNGTLVAGFANGNFGVWGTSSGARLAEGQIHGSVSHLAIHDQVLIVAGDLGAIATMDLSLLAADYCDLLREVWSRVPVIWSSHGALMRAPGASHPCHSRAW